MKICIYGCKLLLSLLCRTLRTLSLSTKIKVTPLIEYSQGCLRPRMSLVMGPAACHWLTGSQRSRHGGLTSSQIQPWLLLCQLLFICISYSYKIERSKRRTYQGLAPAKGGDISLYVTGRNGAERYCHVVYVGLHKFSLDWRQKIACRVSREHIKTLANH